MKTLVITLGTASALLLTSLPSAGQQAPAFDRVPAHILDMAPPSQWVRGSLGQMNVVARECRSQPADVLRRRVVDIAVQEWAFFGFPVVDRVDGGQLLPPGASSSQSPAGFGPAGRRPPSVNAREAERVATSIAGYWAVTPEGRGVIAEQNRLWDDRGPGARWNAPWSAAFISWVMCEAGLGSNDRFRRAVAHWTYIDQAIQARDGRAATAAFEAFDIGERTVLPGDMLCLGRRPQYRNLAERRRQMGVGAQSHCDIVVEVDEPGERILAIGGNVLRSVSLKVLPAQRSRDGGLVAKSAPGVPLFAHLRLRAAPVPGNALSQSPVLAAYTCAASATATRTRFVLGQIGVDAPRNVPSLLTLANVPAEEDGPVRSAGPAANC
jgi:hypothetical protein